MINEAENNLKERERNEKNKWSRIMEQSEAILGYRIGNILFNKAL